MTMAGNHACGNLVLGSWPPDACPQREFGPDETTPPRGTHRGRQGPPPTGARRILTTRVDHERVGQCEKAQGGARQRSRNATDGPRTGRPMVLTLDLDPRVLQSCKGLHHQRHRVSSPPVSAGRVQRAGCDARLLGAERWPGGCVSGLWLT